MKLVIELLAGVAAGMGAFYLARPEHAAPKVDPPVRPRVEATGARPRALDVPAPVRDAAVTPPAPTRVSVDGGPSIAQRSAMTMLRNEVIVASAKDMHLRGADVLSCLEGVQLAGAQKLRFSVEVVSTPLEATTGRWRFVEIAEGEPLPDSFGPCAARALGSGQRLVPPEGFRFPEYSGELEILYTIPAPAAPAAK
jgi:hypothetical protein